ncbi:MAG: hypothetical protein ACXABY_28920 [Candidatus Thorarchaeota archaeon]|jgi:hypothetical protein
MPNLPIASNIFVRARTCFGDYSWFTVIGDNIYSVSRDEGLDYETTIKQALEELEDRDPDSSFKNEWLYILEQCVAEGLIDGG